MSGVPDEHGECPVCGVSWDGGDILEIFKKMRADETSYKGCSDEKLMEYYMSYSEPRRFSRLGGIEIAGYDGVSFWQCPDCKTTWNRFTGALLPATEVPAAEKAGEAHVEAVLSERPFGPLPGE